MTNDFIPWKTTSSPNFQSDSSLYPLMRSILFIPANNKRFLESGLRSQADVLILDLEDSVPSEHRSEARENLIQLFLNGTFRNRTVFIRINPIGTPDFQSDMEALIFSDLTGFMPTKIRTAQELCYLDDILSREENRHGWNIGKFRLAPLIETTSAVLNLHDIAMASSRLVALCLGGEDYLDDLSGMGTHLTAVLEYPRTVIAITARAAGLLPIDTPWLDLNDREHFLLEERKMYEMGFAGCLLLHPKQVEWAHQAFSPTEEELNRARLILTEVRRAKLNGSNIAVYEGNVIGPPMRKLAERLLKQKELIEHHHLQKNKEKSE